MSMNRKIWFDISYLSNWSGNPVGIIRVQMELAHRLLQTDGVSFCKYNSKNCSFEKIPKSEVMSILLRIKSGSNKTKVIPKHSKLGFLKKDLFNLIKSKSTNRSFHIAIDLLSERISDFFFKYLIMPFKLMRLNGLICSFKKLNFIKRQPDSIFDQNSIYINIGLHWEEPIFYEILQQKILKNLSVITMCFDLIPVLKPEYFLNKLTKIFRYYFFLQNKVSDKIVCISEFTKVEFEKWTRNNFNHTASTMVIHLSTPKKNTSKNILVPNRFGIYTPLSFILYVSTIESRKNHQILFDAYKLAYKKDKLNEMPHLILVGRLGWGVEKTISDFYSNSELQQKISIFHDVSDAELHNLYLNCCFTVYPSKYEGWGLPISESLVWGKFCIASDNSSLREASQNLAEHISETDVELWYRVILKYYQNESLLKIKEENIKLEYRSRSWENFYNDFMSYVLKE